MIPDREITIALAGNPNSGKTSIFNLLTGLHHHVGNYPGVTVECMVGKLSYSGYQINVVDLPGTYSLTSYTIEEKAAREFILNEKPDVIINVLDTANLERNLDLTVQLLEMGVDIVVALNMWDEFIQSGAELDLDCLTRLLGAPTIPTVGHRGKGREELLTAVIQLVEDRSRDHRHVPVTYGSHVEDQLVELSHDISTGYSDSLSIPPRYGAIKLLEGDSYIIETLHNRQRAAKHVTASLIEKTERLRHHILQTTGHEPARVISDGRYGFVSGLLKESLQFSGTTDRMATSRKLDQILTHQYFGLPLFVGFMWLLFNATFTLGAYPMAGIELLFEQLGRFAEAALPAGFIADLIIDGMINGVGSVAVFIPNIMILFLGISLLEDTGYMARVAFIMDRVMHLFGLHGKSFIPMLMGFGCTVPAIMATRTLESKRDRILTTLLLPHMSCAARFPVYVLFAGAFFTSQAGNVICAIYLIGVLVALLMGFVFSRTLFRQSNSSFVMELPPYRWPTARGLIGHMWGRTWCYIKKIGTVILFASIILWFLGAYPVSPEVDSMTTAIRQLQSSGAEPDRIEELIRIRDETELSYTVIGRLGKIIAPVIRPLGFDWRMGVSILTGFVAKEVVVSTMGVLYHTGDETDSSLLREKLKAPSSGLTPLIAFAYMIFILIYTPCIAAIATIRRELGERWMWFDISYQLGLAWLIAFVIYQGGRLLGLG